MPAGKCEAGNCSALTAQILYPTEMLRSPPMDTDSYLFSTFYASRATGALVISSHNICSSSGSGSGSLLQTRHALLHAVGSSSVAQQHAAGS